MAQLNKTMQIVMQYSCFIGTITLGGGGTYSIELKIPPHNAFFYVKKRTIISKEVI